MTFQENKEKKRAVRILNAQGSMPRGIDDFAKVRIQQCCFVDKTLLIEDFIRNSDEITLITRPRRFGKTINQSMLRYFFERPTEGNDTQQLFVNTLIADDSTLMKHQGKHPVIFLTFKGAKLPTWEEAYTEICFLIREEILRHPESNNYQVEGFTLNDQMIWKRLLGEEPSQPSDWGKSLQLLGKLLTLHHNKGILNRSEWTYPILLLDEYDAPIHAAYTHTVDRNKPLNAPEGYYQRMTHFMRPLLGNALKGNIYLYKAVLTGILRVAKEDLFSGLNNIGVYGVTEDRYASYFGFTEEEIQALLKQRAFSEHAEAIRSWYNGYHIGEDTPCTIYNPWSVISFLMNPTKVPKPYWVNTSDNALVNTLLRDADANVKEELLRLIAQDNVSIVERIKEDTPLRLMKGTPREIWSLLLAAGYVTCEELIRSSEGDELRARLRIPNREVKSLYKSLIADWFDESARQQQTVGMARALQQGNVEHFAIMLEKFVLESTSYFDVKGKDPERVYQAFMLGLLVHMGEEYSFHSEREAGLGRADLLIIPKKPKQLGMILELKQPFYKESLEEAAEKALQQIEEKQYISAFSDSDCSGVLAVGIAFQGKTLATAHKMMG